MAGYRYEDMKRTLLVPDNVPKILRAHTHILRAVEATGAITFQHAFKYTDFSDSWTMMACLDFLVECGLYYKRQGASGAGQDQILVPVERTA